MEQATRMQFEELTKRLQQDDQTNRCPIWPDALAQSSGPMSDFFTIYWSPLAGGMFRLPFEMASAGSSPGMNEETQKRVSSWIWSRNAAFANLIDGQTALIPTLTSDTIKELAQQSPLTTEQRIDRALQAIGRPPAVIDRFPLGPLDNIAILDPVSQQHLLFRAAAEIGASQDEFEWLLDEMVAAGLVKPADTSSVVGKTKNVLTLQGLHRLETGGVPLASKTAFVAMWFNPDVTEAYERGIKPAIEEAGYAPMRIDRKEHANRIDDEIVAEIRRARFLVCDLTCGMGKDSEDTATAIARGGVYYEAGLAHGLDTPVIWTCREDLIGHVHFDVRQYNFILWKAGAEEALRDALVNRIRAVIT